LICLMSLRMPQLSLVYTHIVSCLMPTLRLSWWMASTGCSNACMHAPLACNCLIMSSDWDHV
jgi:hypothetical protein